MRTPKRRPHETTELLQVKSANKILASDRLGASADDPRGSALARPDLTSRADGY